MDTVVSAYGNKVKYKNEHSPETPPPFKCEKETLKDVDLKQEFLIKLGFWWEGIQQCWY